MYPTRLLTLLVATLALALGAHSVAQVYTFTTVVDGASSSLRDEAGAPVTFSGGDFLVEANGDIIYSDVTAQVVRRLSRASGTVSVVAGTLNQSGYADGPAQTARFNSPSSLARATDGSLIVSDAGNYVIRKIAPDGTVSTVAGRPGWRGTDDGAAAVATFISPNSLTLDPQGNLLLIDTGRIRRITPAGQVSTLFDSLNASTATIASPTAIAFDTAGTLHLAESSRLKKLSNGQFVAFAGASGYGLGLRDGPGDQARFSSTRGLALAPDGSAFVTDYSYHVVRRISPSGVVTTIGGQPGIAGYADLAGGQARFTNPSLIRLDRDGSPLVLEMISYTRARLRKGTLITGAPAPIIFKHPDEPASTGHYGALTKVTLSVEATGEPLAYQWTHNGAAIPGATAASHTIARATPADEGLYQVVVANSAATITSRAATVRVYTPSLTNFALRRSEPGGAFLWNIASGGSRLVAVGTDGTILTSFNGDTWTRRDSGTTDWLVGVTYGGGKFVVVGDRGTILTSTDGIAWTRATASGTTQRLNGVTYGDGLFVAVGEAGAAVHSRDAVTWTASTTGATGWLRGLVYEPAKVRPANQAASDGSGRFYATGQGGVIYAGDGTSWVVDYDSRPPQFRGDIEALVTGPIGIGQGGQVISHSVSHFISKGQTMTLPDGRLINLSYPLRVWSNSLMGIDARFRGLALGAGAIFATGENGIIAGAPSPGGPWGLIPSPTTANLVSGAFHGNSLFIVGENGTILQSGALYRSRLVNISTRGLVNASPLISGFVISGNSPKRVLIRAAGPTLASLGVSGALSRPALTLFDSAGRELARNAGWGNATNADALATAAREVGAFAFPSGNLDSAILTTLNPGSYTAQVSGVDGTSGIALVEAYDTDPLSSDETSRAINISTRGHVGEDAQRLIAGFVISGTASRRVLIRAVGPSLARFGVEGTLSRPRIELFQQNNRSATVEAWSTRTDADEVRGAAQTIGAFELLEDSADAAIVATLFPGAWTVHVSGVEGATGTALIEVYDLP